MTEVSCLITIKDPLHRPADPHSLQGQKDWKECRPGEMAWLLSRIRARVPGLPRVLPRHCLLRKKP
ncbi:hypothetical protein E2C01_001796 [Portunus trituberculatus]|uniref:Uncharacterized protein n=1 Tax=Portunus trituberculatus TaxID=210409 RepID=A0A5B7CNF0_PORTR|nr:hypothetical protein [Portunus trituberculatus]